MALSRRRHFTCYVNLETTRPKIRRILRDFQVTSHASWCVIRRRLPAAARPAASPQRDSILAAGRATTASRWRAKAPTKSSGSISRPVC